MHSAEIALDQARKEVDQKINNFIMENFNNLHEIPSIGVPIEGDIDALFAEQVQQNELLAIVQAGINNALLKLEIKDLVGESFEEAKKKVQQLTENHEKNIKQAAINMIRIMLKMHK